MLKAVLLFLAASGLLYLGLLGFLWWKQEALLFYPTPLPAGHRLAVEADVHELAVPVDGATLSVLHLQLPDPKGVVFFLHGNAGNLESWFTHTDFYRQANFDLVMPDYRGYGKSSGRITGAAQLHADVRAVWNAVAPRYQGKRVVVYGRSLGTALAADLAEQLSAGRQPPDLTVLVSPYSSMSELTAEIYPWVPGVLLRYPLDTTRHLRGIRGPVLLVHGAADALIPVSHAQRLQQRVPAARLLVVPRADHNDIHLDPLYQAELAAALNKL